MALLTRFERSHHSMHHSLPALPCLSKSMSGITDSDRFSKLDRMSNLRLSAESSFFYQQYNKNKAKKELHPFVMSEHDSSASEGHSEPQDDFNGFSPEVSRTNWVKIVNENYDTLDTRLKTKQTSINGQRKAEKLNNRAPAAVEKKEEVGTKTNSNDFFQESESLSEKSEETRVTEKTNAKNPPPARKRGKKNAENLSTTETDNAPEPAAKRPKVAGRKEKKPQSLRANPTTPENKDRGRGRGHSKKDFSPEYARVTSLNSPAKSLNDHNRVEAKMAEAKNEGANDMIEKTSEKSKDRICHFLSTSESEVEDSDEEEDFMFIGLNSFRKTNSPKEEAPLPSFKTPTITNKVSESGSPKTSKLRLLPEAAPLLRTPRRTLTLVEEFSPNEDGQFVSDTEDVPDTELTKRSQMKTPLKPYTSRANENPFEVTTVSKRKSFSDSSKKPSPTKRLQFRGKSSQQPIDPGNEINGKDSKFVEAVQERTMLRSANSTDRQVPLTSAIETSTLPVPNRSPLRTNFNFYLASLDDPVRAQHLLSNAECSISLVHLLPKLIFPLKIDNPMLVTRLKGSVEFRSDPHTKSLISLNSSKLLVELKAGRILHAVNTGEKVASFQVIEILQ